MKKATYDKASQSHTIITALGITVLTFFILVSIAGATQDPMVWKYKGSVLSDQNNKAIEINPQNSIDWYSKGRTLYKLNKYDEAIKAYEKAIELNPQDSKSWNNKGIALYNLNKYDEAIKAYDKAIEIDLRNSLAWYNKGDSLGRLNKSDEAKKAYDKANGINPNSPYAWNGNGRDFDNLICLELLRIF